MLGSPFFCRIGKAVRLTPRHCEDFGPWQSSRCPQCVILNVSEESPTRLCIVIVLSLVGIEEIPEFLFVAPPRHSLQAISTLT